MNQDAEVISLPGSCILPSRSDEDEAPPPDDFFREREATELDDVSILSRRASTIRPRRWYDPIRKLWSEKVSVSVPHKDCRDHLANERTFLAYLRTSLALSVIGVIVAQLYTIQHSAKPNPVLGYYVLGKPVATVLQASALMMSLVGTSRYFRQQIAMTRNKVRAGGWEIQFLSAYTLLLLLGLFAIHISVVVDKEKDSVDRVLENFWFRWTEAAERLMLL